MYNLMNGNQYMLGIFYCVFLIVFGSFFLLNLVLAVIMQAFTNVQENQRSEISGSENLNVEDESPQI